MFDPAVGKAVIFEEFDGAPCPFCLSDDTRVWFTTDPHPQWCVLCLTCEAEGPHAPEESQAVDLWNRHLDLKS